MKTINFYLFIFITVILAACQSENKIDIEKIKNEIMQTEKDFERMAAEKGIAEAFWFYADSAAVIKRQNDTLIHGKEQIRNYYADNAYKKATVKWTPDFIDADAHLAYTYGKYVWQFTDSTGKQDEYRGVFHTVWKKQKNGEWKYVWD